MLMGWLLVPRCGSLRRFDEIILSNDTTMVGSIGTMISYMDVRPFLEKHGVKFHEVMAEASYEKNKTFLELMKGNYKLIQEETLNPLNDIFIAAMQENRPNVSEKALHGRMYLAADAIAHGLADSIGNFDFALQRLQILTEAGGRKQETGRSSASTLPSPVSETTMFKTNKFPSLLLLATAFSVENLEAANEELEAQGIKNVTLVADADLEAAEQNATEQRRKIEVLSDELIEVKANHAQAVSEKEAAEKKAEQYGSQPGEKPTQVESNDNDPAVDEAQAVIDNMPHNRAADELFITNNN